MSEAVIVDSGKIESGEDWKALILKILIGMLIVFLAAEFIFYLVVVPFTSRVRVTIEGMPDVGYDEICAMSGITGNEKWMNFNAAETAARLAANPLFEYVSVEKKFPDTVVINVKERTPVAVSLGMINGRTVPMEIDHAGVVFRIGQVHPDENLPIITGLTFENPVAGMRLHPEFHSFLENLKKIELHNPVLLSSISEIKIDEKTYGGYDLIIYPVHTPIRVRTDKTLNEDSLQYMMLVLDVVKDMALNIDEIDIRAGTVAYRVKGDLI